jgi:hypothetical protein
MELEAVLEASDIVLGDGVSTPVGLWVSCAGSGVRFA